MRLWTLHPKYLDSQGLVACWRESLLAQKVLRGETKGYRSHPQLQRFYAHSEPLTCIGRYMSILHEEACRRGYVFDGAKINLRNPCTEITETTGQVMYEWAHLKRKLRLRSPAMYRVVLKVQSPEVHPLFRLVKGGVRDWERV